MLLVMISLFLMFLDLYTNKENTSYQTTACIFFAMLLYDHEKIIKTTKNKVQQIVSKCTAITYIVILSAHIMLLLSMYGKAVVLERTNEGLLGINVIILDKMYVLVDWPFVIVSVLVFILTFVEIFSENNGEDEVINQSGSKVAGKQKKVPEKGVPAVH